jgi:hypothetical protein
MPDGIRLPPSVIGLRCIGHDEAQPGDIHSIGQTFALSGSVSPLSCTLSRLPSPVALSYLPWAEQSPSGL